VKPLAAFDDGDAELLFELPDATREGRLGDVARLRGAGEGRSRANAVTYCSCRMSISKVYGR
jgi:hypothetical protein